MKEDSPETDTPLDCEETESKRGIPFWLRILLCCLSGTMLSFCFPGMGNQAAFVFLWTMPLFYSLFTLHPKKRGLALFLLPGYLALYFGIFGFIIAKWANPWLAPKPKIHKNRIDAKIAKRLEQEPPGRMAQSFKDSMRCLQYALMHASLGTALYNIPILAQTAELVGVIGLSFFPMFFTSVLFQLVHRMIKEASNGRMKPHWDMGIAGLILSAMFGFGVLRLYDLTDAEKKDFGVVLVQQNISQATKHNQDNHLQTMMSYVSYSKEGIVKADQLNSENFKQALADDSIENFKEEVVDAVVWPESTILNGLHFSEDTKKYSGTELEFVALERTISEGAPLIITGCNEYHFATGADYPTESYNSIAFVHNNQGALAIDKDNIYQKNHLVIFGEYIPLRETFPFLENIVGGSAGVGPNFNSGNSTDSTNDGWFGESEQPVQHMMNASFRCIELRRPMIRSANTGVSCVINAGDWFIVLCAALFLTLLVRSMTKRAT